MIKTLLIALVMVSGAHATTRPIATPQITAKSIVGGAKKLAGQTSKDLDCLAYSIYREAGNQTIPAQVAVGQVHINRAREGSWGSHLCQVVYAKAQFSWTLESRVVGWNDKQYKHYRKIAEALVTGVRVKGLDDINVLHYYANYVSPRWAKQGQLVAVAGAHLFIKDVPH